MSWQPGLVTVACRCRQPEGVQGSPLSHRGLSGQASLLTSFPKLANPTYLPEPSPRSLLPAYSKLTV